MFNTLKHFTPITSDAGRTRRTPQDRPIPSRVRAMKQNAAGGYAFALDDFARLERFLVLGADGGTFYATERSVAIENAGVVARCVAADAERTVATIVEISTSGRAPRQDPAILALAIAASSQDEAARKAALDALPDVARTGTHLFQFAAAVERFRGWGRGLRRAVGAWYVDRPVEALALQAMKYAGRSVGGARWTHRDLLRLAHPETDEPARRALLAAILKRDAGEGPGVTGDAALAQWDAAETLRTSEGLSPAEVAAAIRAHRLPREVVPTAALKSADVWEALLEDMPMTAMIRGLGQMSSVGLLSPGSRAAATVVKRLSDGRRLKSARVHPIALAMARATYAAGHGLLGRLRWEPAPEVVEALDAAFIAAFQHAPRTGKRLMLALDVSGSMGWGQVGGSALTPREAAAAMALATLHAEGRVDVRAFETKLTGLPLRKGMGLAKAVAAVTNRPFGATDCSAPMRAATRENAQIDAFVIYTDSETWAGRDGHPMEALWDYRERTGIDAKLIVVGLVANDVSIADPDDGGALDVVGFDAAAPRVLADFIRG